LVDKDLNDPHAAAMWDLKISGMDALVGRKDLNNPHAAAMWDLVISKVASRLRKDLNDPHAAAMWDLKIPRMDTLVGRYGLERSTRCRDVGFGDLEGCLAS